MKILGIDRQSGFSNIPKAIEADRKDKFGPLELGVVRVARPAPASQLSSTKMVRKRCLLSSVQLLTSGDR